MVDRFVKWQQEYPRICQEIRAGLSHVNKEEFNHLTAEGILHPSVDPQFQFDIKHPFPLTPDLRHKLEEEYKIFTSPNNGSNIWYMLDPISSDIPTKDGAHTSVYCIGLYQGGQNIHSFEWSNSSLVTPNIKILYEDKIIFSMRWALPIDERFDFSIFPGEFFLKYGVMPVYYPEIPGAFIPSICDAFCEYLAYKRLIGWVEKL